MKFFPFSFSVFLVVVVVVLLTPYQCEHSPVIVPAKMSDDSDIGICSQDGQNHGNACHCPGDAHQHWRSHAIRMFKCMNLRHRCGFCASAPRLFEAQGHIDAKVLSTQNQSRSLWMNDVGCVLSVNHQQKTQISQNSIHQSSCPLFPASIARA